MSTIMTKQAKQHPALSKITVGVPVYNTEQYLYQALQSVKNQTYQDLEIIVVDDGSTDNSGYIIDKMAEDDPRITVIHQENTGLSAVRESIVQRMTGDAVYWLDSDDYLEPDAIASAAEEMEEKEADIVKTIIKKRESRLSGIYSREEYMKILLPDTITGNVIGCLIRKETYSGLHHHPRTSLEDYYMFPKLMGNAERILVVDNGTYHYRQVRPGSITYEGRISFRGYYPRAMMTCERYDMYKDRYPRECAVILKQFTDYALMACLYAKEEDQEKAREVREQIILHEKEISMSDQISLYKKWLMREVLSRGKLVKVAAKLHKISGRMRLRRERLQGQTS